MLVMTQFKYINEVCVRVGGRTLRHNQIFSDVIVYPILLPMVLRCARESSAIINYYRFPPWPALKALNAYRPIFDSNLNSYNNNNKNIL